MVILDTHVWVWAVSGDATRLGRAARRQLSQPVDSSPVWVSAISAFEITALHRAGRLRLSQPVDRWIRESIDRGGFRVIEVSAEIAGDAGAIPASALADPIDRLLVATARDYGVPLMTRDRAVLDYATRTGLVKVVDASR